MKRRSYTRLTKILDYKQELIRILLRVWNRDQIPESIDGDGDMFYRVRKETPLEGKIESFVSIKVIGIEKRK